MSKILRSPRVFSALFNVTEEKNTQRVFELAQEEYDHQRIQYLTIDHTFCTDDEAIRFDIRMSYEIQHTLEAEGEFTPADHSMSINNSIPIKIAVWLGEEEFRVPITKGKTSLINAKIEE